TLNIGCWNINQRAGSRNTLIPSLVFEELMIRKLDILVLTEFYETSNSKELVSNLNNADYTVKISEYEVNSNQILVAIKNELVNTDIDVHCFNNNDNLPNLLHLRINDLNIIGTRIKIGPYSKIQEIVNQDFMDRRNQLNKLIDYASNLEGQILILGDFNNGKHSENDIDKIYKNDNLTNLLHLRINDLNIIGTRIKIGPYSKIQEIVNQDFMDRRNQLNKLIDYASNLEGQILILGDFNNGKHSENDIDKIYKG